ncbi:heavy metal translocating P-type ATPase [Kaistia granuli]|uniref:heavy metal translocating P-type ATPase n=1 Tax=Kaistia granuli TaxID=363259 RepID=UPI000377A189|nr:heavy metal translocating P-type ATPase [Kaistia granuli]
MGIQDRYRITGMDCASCAQKIDTAVRRIDGVEDVSVSVSAGTMTVRRGEALDPADPIQKIVAKLGYGIAPLAARAAPVAPAPAPQEHDHDACGGHDHDHGAHHHGHSHDHGSHDHDHDHGHSPAAPVAAAAPKIDLHSHDVGEDDGAWWQSKKARLTFAAGAAIVVAFLVSHLFPETKPITFAIAMLFGLVPIARRAFMAARYGTPFSIETLMTIAAVGAVIIGAAEEAAMVVFLFLIGELLEGVAARRARSSIRGLATLLPETARVEEAGGTREVAAADLQLGSIIQIRPGDRIAADGLILGGESAIDEAPVTGESVPKRKGVGDTVFAGTINADGVIRVEVTAVASDNTIARIVRLVEEAQEAKAPTERFIDRFSRWYTPAVLVVGALVAIVPPLAFGGDWGEWIYKGLAILLIGCPCALVISTPAAIAAGLAAGARQGLLMKGGSVLETLAGINRVAFDKTGTLTLGRPVVSDVVGYGRTEAEVIALAASLETGSNHPLARAILGKATDMAAPTIVAQEIAAVAGKGMTGKVGADALLLGSAAAAAEITPLTVEQEATIAALGGEGKSVSVLLVNGAITGIIAMRDGPRADAREGLAELKALDVAPIMLTGDNARAAKAVGGDLGIEVRAELLPQDKQRIIRELQAGGAKVAKVGDGINDAPALAAADVGIAMGGGTDVALETADAAILNNNVGDVARLIRLARRTMRNIHQNIVIALGLKAVFLVTTIVGITGLWPAILADTGATVLVTINALTLLVVKKKA